MNTEVIIEVTANGQLELPTEVRERLSPGEKYKVSMTEDSIVLEKVQKTEINLDDWFRRIEEVGSDPEQPTLHELADMVKEIRRDRKTRKPQT
ncbi:MAG: hypothetical protein HC866_05100 [Leptolyngbyaceae cyanobacterium RU_5_1]|nr:hypothetical protein [Leptolyngbyaceae cyanobacterium RU_5_1]